jgi:hypothetical protein
MNNQYKVSYEINYNDLWEILPSYQKSRLYFMQKYKHTKYFSFRLPEKVTVIIVKL